MKLKYYHVSVRVLSTGKKLQCIIVIYNFETNTISRHLSDSRTLKILHHLSLILYTSIYENIRQHFISLSYFLSLMYRLTCTRPTRAEFFLYRQRSLVFLLINMVVTRCITTVEMRWQKWWSSCRPESTLSSQMASNIWSELSWLTMLHKHTSLPPRLPLATSFLNNWWYGGQESQIENS